LIFASKREKKMNSFSSGFEMKRRSVGFHYQKWILGSNELESEVK
jgi:hypothetical protein